MNKEEKIYTIIPIEKDTLHRDKQINNLSLLEIEQLLREKKIHPSIMLWKEGMNDITSLFAYFLIEKKIDIPKDLQKDFDYQKILNYIGSIDLTFDFIKDDTEVMPEEIPNECDKGKNKINAINELLNKLYLNYL